MTAHSLLWAVIIVGASTYLIRALSLIAGSHLRWPSWAQDWIAALTPAILGSLFALQIAPTPSSIEHSNWIAEGTAFAAAAVVACRSRNLLLTVAVGLALFAGVSRIPWMLSWG